MLTCTALVTKYLSEFVKQREGEFEPILVGGLSLELYTRSNYMTRDVDLVSSDYNRKDIGRFLEDIGFKPLGKDWYSTEHEISLEIPDNELDGSYEKVVKIHINDELYLYVIGVEDLILDRLDSFAMAEQHYSDREWAERLYLTHKESMDIDYLVNESKKRNTHKYMKEWE